MNKPATMKDNKLAVKDMLEKHSGEMAKVLPKHLTPERLARISLSEMTRNPELQNCSPISFMSAVMQCSQMGLEPSSTLGLVHLIPFNNKKTNQKEVQVIIGYQGLIELSRRTGKIKTITAECVYSNDKFKATLGLDSGIEHEADFFEDRGDFKGVYAIAKFKDETFIDAAGKTITIDGGHQYAIMSKGDLMKIKNKKKYPNPIWDSDFDEMAKKTVIRRLSKMLPKSPELQTATVQMNQIDNDGQVDHYEYLKPIGIEETIIKEAKPARVANKEKAHVELARETIYKKIDVLFGLGVNCENVVTKDFQGFVESLATVADCATVIEKLAALMPQKAKI